MKGKQDKSQIAIQTQDLAVYPLLQLLYQHDEVAENNRNFLSMEASMLTMKIQDFTQLQKSMNEQELLRYVNGTLPALIEEVKAHGGVVYEYLGSGLQAFFSHTTREALEGALGLCPYLGGEEKGSIGLCYGNLLIGMIGIPEHWKPTVISDMAEVSEYLEQIGPNYLAKVVALGSFTDKMEDFQKRYLHRFLGYLYIGSNGTVEKMYDIFQGDEPEIMWRKKKTKLMFEDGVHHFAAAKYLTARARFIEVLKAFPKDQAARHYLQTCDQYLERPERIPVKNHLPGCIETYG
ncbi:MAG: hypothetical protein LBM69_08550 [Lachnospiraceae bacterium]|nr:hypothetical protein [Lachnospiraceae bacterium]